MRYSTTLALLSAFLLSPPLAFAQVDWSGDFRGNNFYQYRYIHCGSFENAVQGMSNNTCPYDLQAANVSTTTGSINCSDSLGNCRFAFVTPPANSSAFASKYAPLGRALKVLVKFDPSDPNDLTKGDNAPPEYHWGDNHRNELNKARDANGQEILHGEGEDRYYGWSVYVPPETAPSGEPVFPPFASATQTYHTLLQFHQEGLCKSPYIDVGIDAYGSTDWQFVLNTINQYPGDAYRLWPISGQGSPIERERWYNFVLRVKWSTNPSVGHVTFWVDGQQVYGASRQTLFSFNQTGCSADGSQTGTMKAYLKTGMYRSKHVRQNETIYQHGLKMGRSYADVDPTGLKEQFGVEGLPVDWEIQNPYSSSTVWRFASSSDPCGVSSSNAVVFNRHSGGSCNYRTQLSGQFWDSPSSGTLLTKPFATFKGGAQSGTIQFKQISETEQLRGYDTRAVYIVHPSVPGDDGQLGHPTEIAKWCGGYLGRGCLCENGQPCDCTCPDQGNWSAGTWDSQVWAIPSDYLDKNNVRLMFEFTTGDWVNNVTRGWAVDDVRVTFP